MTDTTALAVAVGVLDPDDHVALTIADVIAGIATIALAPIALITGAMLV